MSDGFNLRVLLASENIKKQSCECLKLAAAPLEVPVSVLKDVLHPKVLMEYGAKKLTKNPSLVSRNKAVEKQGRISMSNSLVSSC